MRIAVLGLVILALAACHRPNPHAAGNREAGDAFLAANAKQAGVHVLADGLQYRIVRSGPADGLRPHVQDEVKVNYEGKLLSGHVFDSSFERGQPVAFKLEGLIPGWVEALQQMRPGDDWILYLPSTLAYGDKDMGGGEIPGGSTLIFRIQLLGVLPHEGSVLKG